MSSKQPQSQFAVVDRRSPLRKPGQPKALVWVTLKNGFEYEVADGALPAVGEDARKFQLRALSEDAAAPLVAEAMADRFRDGATPRSMEYRAGFEAKLRFKIRGGTAIVCPHQEGTAQADAWWSGEEHASHYWTTRAARLGAPLYE
jgi:hypothetical protein